jgi:ABC-type transport system involved in multi-copper enzyme maturation permease subunit
MIATITSHQILSLRRQRVFATAMTTLTAVTVMAGILGWSSYRTIVGVYDEAVELLATRGQGAPPHPFLLKPALSMLSNMVIYITLMGALVAIVIGHLSVADDESTGIGRLLFSRQVTRTDYVLGKLAASAIVLAIGMLACALVSVVALLIVNHTMPSGVDLVRLAGFYTLSWLYLMVFALVGMITVLITRRRSLALLSAIGVWLVITFVLPQFTSGLRPSTALNPIVDPVSTSQTFFKVTANARPYSIGEQFKEASGRILKTATTESTGATIVRIAPIAGLFVLLALATASLVHRHDFSRSTHSE